MKRALLWPTALLVALGASGCPIYSNDRGCFSDSDCGNGYLCESPSGLCVRAENAYACKSPADCYPNYTCGADRHCSAGSCQLNGCVSGYSCRPYSGSWACLRDGSVGIRDSGVDVAATDASGSDASSGLDSSLDSHSDRDDGEQALDGSAAEASSDSSTRDGSSNPRDASSSVGDARSSD
jgi:hypothetical protein